MTITKLALAVLLAVAIATPCQAAPSPEEIIDAFFGPDPNAVPDRAASYTGEMKRLYSEEPTIGQMLLPGRHYTARRVASSPADGPVYDVTIERGGETHHWFAYFTREDGVLKLKAVRLAERKAGGDGGRQDDVATPSPGR